MSLVLGLSRYMQRHQKLMAILDPMSKRCISVAESFGGDSPGSSHRVGGPD